MRPASLKTLLERERDFFRDQLDRVNMTLRSIEKRKDKPAGAHKDARVTANKKMEAK